MSSHDELIPRKSKAQQKREAAAAQQLGAELAALSIAQLNSLCDKLDLPDDLQEALRAYHSIKAHEARRRQMQFIGKLMRDIDVAPIQQQLAQIKQSGLVETTQLHLIERWRDRLLSEGKTVLTELLQHYPEADARQLQQLITRAHKEAAHNQPPRAARQLFKLLRSILSEPND